MVKKELREAKGEVEEYGKANATTTTTTTMTN